jgi:hypothetical protein
VQGHELSNGPVIGFLNIWWKATCRKFIMFSMTSQTFTASTFQVAVVSARAVFQVGLQTQAFTQALHPMLLNIPPDLLYLRVYNLQKRESANFYFLKREKPLEIKC